MDQQAINQLTRLVQEDKQRFIDTSARLEEFLTQEGGGTDGSVLGAITAAFDGLQSVSSVAVPFLDVLSASATNTNKEFWIAFNNVARLSFEARSLQLEAIKRLIDRGT